MVKMERKYYVWVWVLLVIGLLVLTVYFEDDLITGAAVGGDDGGIIYADLTNLGDSGGSSGSSSSGSSSSGGSATNPSAGISTTKHTGPSATAQSVSDIGTTILEHKSYNDLSNAFFEANTKADWREDVDSFFARNYLGVDYWSSAVCSKYHPIINENVAVIETPEGIIQFVAHIEGDRSDPVPVICVTKQDCVDRIRDNNAKCVNSICELNNEVVKEYFYKVTGTVKAPSDLDLTPQRDDSGAISFTVVFKGEQIIPAFLQFIPLDNGEKYDITLLPFYSTHKFDQVCIWFGKKPLTSTPGGGRHLTQEICNSMAETPRSYNNAANNDATIGGGTGSGDNVNDDIFG